MTEKLVPLLQTYPEVIPYITKDGSQIRELMHPGIHGTANQSLAEAIVPVGCKTFRHKHICTEEIYHITQGKGQMTLAHESFAVQAGDTISIPKGTDHCIENIGATPLILLCACSPAYSHEDTLLT